MHLLFMFLSFGSIEWLKGKIIRKMACQSPNICCTVPIDDKCNSYQLMDGRWSPISLRVTLIRNWWPSICYVACHKVEIGWHRLYTFLESSSKSSREEDSEACSLLYSSRRFHCHLRCWVIPLRGSSTLHSTHYIWQQWMSMVAHVGQYTGFLTLPVACNKKKNTQIISRTSHV